MLSRAVVESGHFLGGLTIKTVILLIGGTRVVREIPTTQEEILAAALKERERSALVQKANVRWRKEELSSTSIPRFRPKVGYGKIRSGEQLEREEVARERYHQNRLEKAELNRQHKKGAGGSKGPQWGSGTSKKSLQAAKRRRRRE